MINEWRATKIKSKAAVATSKNVACHRNSNKSLSILDQFNEIGREQADLACSREFAFVPSVVTFLLQNHNIAYVKRKLKAGVCWILGHATIAFGGSGGARWLRAGVETA